MDWDLYIKTAYTLLAILMLVVLPFSLLICFILGVSLTLVEFAKLIAILSACYLCALAVVAIMVRND